MVRTFCKTGEKEILKGGINALVDTVATLWEMII